MPSEVDIGNMALSEIGTRSTISSFDDGSVEATACGIWYARLRQQLLRTAPWGFARTQIGLTQVGSYDPAATGAAMASPFPYLFSYAYPSDCLKLRYVLVSPCPPITGQINPPVVGSPGPFPGLFPSRRNRFLIHNQVDANGNGNKVILSNVQSAIGVYTRDETNPDLFDSLFLNALVSSLAFRLVMPLTGEVSEREQFRRSAMQAIEEARAADANEAIPSSDYTPDWIRTREVGWGAGPGFSPAMAAWGQWFGGYDNMAWGA